MVICEGCYIIEVDFLQLQVEKVQNEVEKVQNAL